MSFSPSEFKTVSYATRARRHSNPAGAVSSDPLPSDVVASSVSSSLADDATNSPKRRPASVSSASTVCLPRPSRSQGGARKERPPSHRGGTSDRAPHGRSARSQSGKDDRHKPKDRKRAPPQPVVDKRSDVSNSPAVAGSFDDSTAQDAPPTSALKGPSRPPAVNVWKARADAVKQTTPLKRSSNDRRTQRPAKNPAVVGIAASNASEQAATPRPSPHASSSKPQAWSPAPSTIPDNVSRSSSIHRTSTTVLSVTASDFWPDPSQAAKGSAHRGTSAIGSEIAEEDVVGTGASGALEGKQTKKDKVKWIAISPIELQMSADLATNRNGKSRSRRIPSEDVSSALPSSRHGGKKHTTVGGGSSSVERLHNSSGPSSKKPPKRADVVDLRLPPQGTNFSARGPSRRVVFGSIESAVDDQLESMLAISNAGLPPGGVVHTVEELSMGMGEMSLDDSVVEVSSEVERSLLKSSSHLASATPLPLPQAPLVETPFVQPVLASATKTLPIPIISTALEATHAAGEVAGETGPREEVSTTAAPASVGNPPVSPAGAVGAQGTTRQADAGNESSCTSPTRHAALVFVPETADAGALPSVEVRPAYGRGQGGSSLAGGADPASGGPRKGVLSRTPKTSSAAALSHSLQAYPDGAGRPNRPAILSLPCAYPTLNVPGLRVPSPQTLSSASSSIPAVPFLSCASAMPDEALSTPSHASPPMPLPITTPSVSLDPLRYYLLGQLEYYFGIQNLAMDFFLRTKMDSLGFVDILVIASFNRVKNLTADVSLVREMLELSQLVEVRGMHVRLANRAWEQWILPDAPRSEVVEMEEDGDNTDEGNLTKEFAT